MTRTLTFALLLAVFACGGHKPAPATAPTTSEHHHEGGEEAEEHENLPPEMKAFHDLLAPRWHADKGPQRQADTCGAIDQFKASADTVGKATPPVPANADTWTAATKALVAAVANLETACTSKGDFEGSFAKVHDSFHALMEQGAMEGGGNMSGKGGEKGPDHHDDAGHDHHDEGHEHHHD